MDFFSLASLDRVTERIRRTIGLLSAGSKYLRDAPPGDTQADKAACEIALLLWGLQRNGHLDMVDASVLRELLRVCVDRLQSESVLQGILWKPARIPALAMGTGLLAALGAHNESFGRIATIAWDGAEQCQAERSPYQVLEAGWSARLLGREHPLEIPPGCLLLGEFTPLLMGVEDGYAFTHSVFYATDFGGSPLPRELIPRNLWRATEAGILWSLVRFDFDLLCEYLLVALYSDMPHTPALWVGLAALMLTWDENGFVPDRYLAPESLNPAGVFFGIYHANIVAALLMSEVCKRGVDGPSPEQPRITSSSIEEKERLRLRALAVRFCDGQAVDIPGCFSAREFLGGLLGTGVARRLSAALGDVVLRDIHNDLLIADAFVRGDVGLLAVGVGQALDREDLSAAAACAFDQLALVANILDVTRN